jgi:sporulation protein YtfJ
MDINHPIEGLMKSTMESIRDMIDVNTVIGDPFETKDGTTILPISKATFGFGSGGSEFEHPKTSSNVNSYPFGGGSGAGVCLRPVGFLIINGANIRLLSLDHDNTYDRILDSIPQLVDLIKGFSK